MFGSSEETKFLFSLIDSTKTVLEWGSGSSTIEIGERCFELYSIEHDGGWYEQIRSRTKENTKLYLVPHNKPLANGLSDGNLEEFYTYVNLPTILQKQFDVIFIDGRARYECAKVAQNILKDDGIILIHDYNDGDPTRENYKKVLEFLDMVDTVERLAAFRKQR